MASPVTYTYYDYTRTETPLKNAFEAVMRQYADIQAEVKRSQEIVIEYVNIEELKRILDTNWNERQNSGRDKADEAKTPDRTELPMVRDTVRGFTAVIFQHEVDHLDGILYIDRL